MNPSILDTLTPMVLNKEISLELACFKFLTQEKGNPCIITVDGPNWDQYESSKAMLVQVIDVIR